jgi:hypothetical protein
MSGIRSLKQIVLLSTGSGAIGIGGVATNYSCDRRVEAAMRDGTSEI